MIIKWWLFEEEKTESKILGQIFVACPFSEETRISALKRLAVVVNRYSLISQ
jgi:hypothetical protein